MQTEEQETLEVLYARLRILCGRAMRREDPGHTLEGTALANEVFLRLREADFERATAPLVSTRWFFAMASTLIRQAVVDHARTRRRLKRGGGWARSALEPEQLVGPESRRTETILLVDGLLEELAEISPRQSQIAQLRFFGGLTFAQIALVVELSESGVRREWSFAQVWLGERLAARERP